MLTFTKYTSPSFSGLKPLLLAFFMLLGALGLQAAGYASNSVMKDGKWVKISIKEEGMQILTAAQLKNLGFSDPSKVQVYGYGGYRLSESLNSAQVYDLPQQPVVRLANGSIVFYGAGLVNWEAATNCFGFQHIQNVYSTTSNYFLSDREASDLQPQALTTPVSTSATPVDSFTQLMVYENDLYAPGDTGGDLFGEDFRTSSKRRFSFPVTDAVGSQMTFHTIFGAKASGRSTLTFNVDGKNIGTQTINNAESASSETMLRFSNNLSRADIGDKTALELAINFSGSGTVYDARLDYIEASYERALRLNGGVLQFRHTTAANQVLRVQGCSSSTLIWDVTNPAAPQPVTFELQGSTARFAPAGSGMRTYIAFNPDDVKNAPASAGKVSNQDIHGMEIPDMVIICPDEYKAQAQRIADMHKEADDMVVHLLSPQQIYNEFSSGRPDITAYRKMLKMFWDRSQADPSGRQLQACLLFGRPSYDHRLITEIPKNAGYPRVLIWETLMNWSTASSGATMILAESSSNSFCTDNYIACLNNDPGKFSMSAGKMSIGVGRMPVKSVAEAKSAVDKLLGFLSDPDAGSWRSRVMLIADDADYGEHFTQTEAMYKNMCKTGNGSDFIYERLYLDSYPLGTGSTKSFPAAREKMFKTLDEGVSLLTFVGHANPTSWTHEGLMTYSDIISLKYKHLPIIYHASCEFVRFDSDSESGAETMWLNPSSGAIAFIAANRKVYISSNGQLSAAFGSHYFQRDSQNRSLPIGEVFRLAVNDLGNQTNKHCYAVMGDPMMRVPSPERSVKAETIGTANISAATNPSDYPVVPARSKMIVTGKIALPSGAVDTTFNGTITATLFDAERAIETYGHPSAEGKSDGKVCYYNDRKNRLAIASFPVKNGQWEAQLYLPEEIEDNYSPALLAMYALSSSGTEAIGSTTKFYVYGYDDTQATDSIAPEIFLLALGNPSFKPGDTVGSTTTFLAKVRDDSGINISSAGIGKQMMLILDGKTIFDDLSDYFVTDPEDPTGGSISYPLADLQNGDHEFTFQVFDNAGNCAKQTIPFKVGAGIYGELELHTDASPASVEANIYIVTAQQPVEAKVEIFDMAGRCVWSATPDVLSQSMRVNWDLTMKGGTRVPRGIYLYRATVKNADGAEKARTRKIAVTAP